MIGSPTAVPGRGELRLATTLSLLLGALLALASLVGLLTGVGGGYAQYPVSEGGLFAQDLVILFGALPLLLAGMWLARRGSLAGLFLWAGLLFYAAYTYYFMVIGAFTVLFPVYIGIVAVGTYGLLALLAVLDTSALAARFVERAPRRAVAVFFGLIVALFLVLWGGLVASSLAAGEELNPVQHLVVAIDGAILLPILAYGAVRVWQGTPSGYLLGGLLLVKSAATGFTLAFTGAFAMLSTGEFDGTEIFLAAVFSVMTVSAAALLVGFLPKRGTREG